MGWKGTALNRFDAHRLGRRIKGLFTIFEVEDTIGIPPKEFGRPLKEVALQQLRSLYEGLVNEELGYVIAVVDVDVDPLGYVLPRDGSTYHRCKLTLLTFLPQIQEVIEGEVVELTEFGAFVRVGPVDALLHISQIMDDYLSYDEKHAVLMGKKTGRTLTVGDSVRARIVAVSLASGATGKIGITTRQPFLGKLEWIKEEAGKAKPAEKVETSVG